MSFVSENVNKNQDNSFVTDLLTGVLKNDYDDKQIKKERIESKENKSSGN